MESLSSFLPTLIDAFGAGGAVVIAGVSFAWWLERSERKEISKEVWNALLKQSETNSTVAAALREISAQMRGQK